MSDATFTFRVEQSLKDEFAAAAKQRDRNGAQLLRDFMRDYIQQQHDVTEHDAWFRHSVQAGIDSANAGELVSAEEAETDAAQWSAAIKRQLADKLA